jgi:hypothetical protein
MLVDVLESKVRVASLDIGESRFIAGASHSSPVSVTDVVLETGWITFGDGAIGGGDAGMVRFGIRSSERRWRSKLGLFRGKGELPLKEADWSMERGGFEAWFIVRGEKFNNRNFFVSDAAAVE